MREPVGEGAFAVRPGGREAAVPTAVLRESAHGAAAGAAPLQRAAARHQGQPHGPAVRRCVLHRCAASWRLIIRLCFRFRFCFCFCFCLAALHCTAPSSCRRGWSWCSTRCSTARCRARGWTCRTRHGRPSRRTSSTSWHASPSSASGSLTAGPRRSGCRASSSHRCGRLRGHCVAAHAVVSREVPVRLMRLWRQAFLTGILQEHARRFTIPIDDLVFDTLPQRADWNPAASPIPNGVVVHGMFLEVCPSPPCATRASPVGCDATLLCVRAAGRWLGRCLADAARLVAGRAVRPVSAHRAAAAHRACAAGVLRGRHHALRVSRVQDDGAARAPVHHRTLHQLRHGDAGETACAVCCCVLCAVCDVLCAVCCVLCAVCCVLCAVCCVLCAVCCVRCAVCWRARAAANIRFAVSLLQLPSTQPQAVWIRRGVALLLQVE